ncbi:BTB/POZ domain-containing protein [Aphelenchoides avenae]|nr:BTB/POZ domain-containing protein [Aphelenchus avenae]
MTCDDVKAFQLAEDRDEWGMAVVLAVVEKHKLLSATIGFVSADISEEDICVTDVCGAPFNAFHTAETLAADVKLKVGDTVFYANKGYLSVVSSVFRDMFAFTEAADEDKEDTQEIKLNDLDASDFKEFLGVVYTTCYPITDYNVTRMFRIADRYDVKRVINDCESHLYGANNVPLLDKLKLAVDLNRDQLKRHFILEMTWDDFETLDRNDKKDQLRMDVLQALIDEHIPVRRP